MKRLIGLVVIALVIFWVIAQPDSAAGFVQGIFNALRDGADAVIRFFTQLV